MAAKNAIVSWLLNFRIRMFVKSAVIPESSSVLEHFVSDQVTVPKSLFIRMGIQFTPLSVH